MTEKIESKELLTTGSVIKADRESSLERILRISPDIVRHVGAYLICVAAIVICAWVIQSENPKLDQFKQPAFTLFITVVGAASAAIFGNRRGDG